MKIQKELLGKSILSLTLAIVIYCIGCGPVATTKPKQLTALEYFKNEQANTVTPHGKIIIDRVKESNNNKLEYMTDDGSTWSVGYKKRSDGTYEYDKPPTRLNSVGK